MTAVADPVRSTWSVAVLALSVTDRTQQTANWNPMAQLPEERLIPWLLLNAVLWMAGVANAAESMPSRLSAPALAHKVLG